MLSLSLLPPLSSLSCSHPSPPLSLSSLMFSLSARPSLSPSLLLLSLTLSPSPLSLVLSLSPSSLSCSHSLPPSSSLLSLMLSHPPPSPLSLIPQK